MSLLKAFYLHVGLIKTISDFYFGDVDRVLRLYEFDSLFERLTGDDLKMYRSDFLRNEGNLREIVWAVASDEVTSVRHPISMRAWLRLCRATLKDTLMSNENDSNAMEAFHNNVVVSINRQLRIGDKVRDVLYYFIRESYAPPNQVSSGVIA